MNPTDETKQLNQTTIQTVGRLLGLKLPTSGMVNCPFPDHEDRIPSFEVKKSGNRWRCYGCDRSGGAIDFVKLLRGTDFLEAKCWLASATGLVRETSPFPTERRTRSIPNIVSTPDTEIDLRESLPDCEVYESLLQYAPLERSGRTYLLNRALSGKTISRFRIGQVSDRRAILSMLLENFGFKRIEHAGLLTTKSTTHQVNLVFSPGSLLFPFMESHRTVYVQGRLTSNSGARGKWRNLNHRRLRVYNVDALDGLENDRIAICEGVIDTLSAIELGYRAIGLMGVSARLDKHHTDSLRGKEVDVLFDWDPAGEKRAKEIQCHLRRFGIASTRKRRPSAEVEDLNDYLRVLRTPK